MKGIFVVVLLLSLGIAGCTTGTVKTVVMPDTDLKNYKTAYVDILPQDEFNLGTAIMTHLVDMGFVVKAAPLPPEILNTDLLVKYDYYTGWDIRRYLMSFYLQFLDAQQGDLLLTSRYELSGLWRGADFRINYAFNDIRTKGGYPPLRGF